MEWTSASEAQNYGAKLLEGKRIRLRALEEADVPQLATWWRDPAWAVLQQLIVRPRPAENAEQMFRDWSGNGKAGDVGFCVVDREDDTLVGHVTLYGAGLPVRAATMAIMIGSEYVGRGYGTDTLRTFTNYGFREMGLNRIEIRVNAFNDKAHAVYRRLGYVQEGVRREITFHDGAFHDEIILSMLASEWNPHGVDTGD